MEGERTRQFARGLGETLAGIRSKGFAQSNEFAQQAGTNFLNIGNQLQRQQLAQMGGFTRTWWFKTRYCTTRTSKYF